MGIIYQKKYPDKSVCLWYIAWNKNQNISSFELYSNEPLKTIWECDT